MYVEFRIQVESINDPSDQFQWSFIAGQRPSEALGFLVEEPAVLLLFALLLGRDLVPAVHEQLGDELVALPSVGVFVSVGRRRAVHETGSPCPTVWLGEAVSVPA